MGKEAKTRPGIKVGEREEGDGARSRCRISRRRDGEQRWCSLFITQKLTAEVNPCDLRLPQEVARVVICQGRGGQAQAGLWRGRGSGEAHTCAAPPGTPLGGSPQQCSEIAVDTACNSFSQAPPAQCCQVLAFPIYPSPFRNWHQADQGVCVCVCVFILQSPVNSAWSEMSCLMWKFSLCWLKPCFPDSLYFGVPITSTKLFLVYLPKSDPSRFESCFCPNCISLSRVLHLLSTSIFFHCTIRIIILP